MLTKRPDPEFPFSTEDQAHKFAFGAGYIVKNGVAYRPDSPSRFRLDARKGKLFWTYMV